jgi:predicted amidohydrolase
MSKTSQSSNSLRVAMASFKSDASPVEKTLARMQTIVKRAADQGAAFIGFPEAALNGYFFPCPNPFSLKGPELAEVSRWSRELGVVIAVGLIEKRGDRQSNTVAVVGPNGLVGAMRKWHMMHGEAPYLMPGRRFPIVEVAGCRMGILICADASYYEDFRLLSLAGAEVIFAPHANSLASYGQNAAGWKRWRLENWPLYAREQVVAIAGVNTAGELAKNDSSPSKFCGGALVLDHTGKVLARDRARGRRESLVFADIPLAPLREAREKNHVLFRAHAIYKRSVLPRQSPPPIWGAP